MDIFSFGMVIYEMLTLHIPYEAMAGQQANQANEQGKRPPLCRADFPCPVLARELMVWCWQQKPENRPTAPGIMEVATTEQFPRLLDGIRICNCGKVRGRGTGGGVIVSWRIRSADVCVTLCCFYFLVSLQDLEKCFIV